MTVRVASSLYPALLAISSSACSLSREAPSVPQASPNIASCAERLEGWRGRAADTPQAGARLEELLTECAGELRADIHQLARQWADYVTTDHWRSAASSHLLAVSSNAYPDDAQIAHSWSRVARALPTKPAHDALSRAMAFCRSIHPTLDPDLSRQAAEQCASVLPPSGAPGPKPEWLFDEEGGVILSALMRYLRGPSGSDAIQARIAMQSAFARFAREEWAEAAAPLELVLSRHNARLDAAGAITLLATVLVKLERYDDAERWVQQLRGAYGEADANLPFVLDRVLSGVIQARASDALDAGQFDVCARHWERHLTLFPEVDVEQSLFNAAVCHQSARQTVRATELLNTLLRRFPDTPLALDAKARLGEMR